MHAVEPKLMRDTPVSFASEPSEPLKLQFLTWWEDVTYSLYRPALAAAEREARRWAGCSTPADLNALRTPPVTRWPAIAVLTALLALMAVGSAMIGVFHVVAAILTDRLARVVHTLWREPN